MNRITPDMVKQAYEKSGLKPVRGSATIKNGCTCPLGALAFCADVEQDEDSENVYKWAAEQFGGAEYYEAFYSGFDCKPENRAMQREHIQQRYADKEYAFDDGIACAVAVFGE